MPARVAAMHEVEQKQDRDSARAEPDEREELVETSEAPEERMEDVLEMLGATST